MTDEEEYQIFLIKMRLCPSLVLATEGEECQAKIINKDGNWYCSRKAEHEGLHVACWYWKIRSDKILLSSKQNLCPVAPWKS